MNKLKILLFITILVVLINLFIYNDSLIEDRYGFYPKILQIEENKKNNIKHKIDTKYEYILMYAKVIDVKNIGTGFTKTEINLKINNTKTIKFYSKYDNLYKIDDLYPLYYLINENGLKTYLRVDDYLKYFETNNENKSYFIRVLTTLKKIPFNMFSNNNNIIYLLFILYIIILNIYLII